MMNTLQMFLWEPSRFFQERVEEQEMRLLPLLALLMVPLFDFASKTVIFYKLGASSFQAQSDWETVGGGYFGVVIAQEIGFGIKATLVISVCYLIARLLKRTNSFIKLVNLAGYCLMPAAIASFVLILVYAFGLTIPVITLNADAGAQVTAAITSSFTFTVQRLLLINTVVWMGVLTVSMLRCFWHTQLARTLAFLGVAIISAEAASRFIDLVLRHTLI